VLIEQMPIKLEYRTNAPIPHNGHCWRHTTDLCSKQMYIRPTQPSIPPG